MLKPATPGGPGAAPYAGSLATLLWRRILDRHGSGTTPLEFLRLGALTVPPAIVPAAAALWLSLRVVG